MKYLKKICILIAVCLVFACATEGKAKAKNTSYEADIEYILTKYHILGEYEEVIRLLNKYHVNRQNDMGEYRLCEEYFLKSAEINLDNQSLMAESMAGLAVVNMKNKNIELAKAYKESSIRLNFKMNDIRYLTNNLKWSNGVIGIWSGI